MVQEQLNALLALTVHHDTITGTSNLAHMDDMTKRLYKAQTTNSEAYITMI